MDESQGYSVKEQEVPATCKVDQGLYELVWIGTLTFLLETQLDLINTPVESQISLIKGY